MGNLPIEKWQIVPFDRMTQERVVLKMVPPVESSAVKTDIRPISAPKTSAEEIVQKISQSAELTTAKTVEPIAPKAIAANSIKESLNTAPIDNIPDQVESSEDILDELSELNKEIANYPENSLEYRALKQEIEHFKKSKKFKI